MKVVISVGGSLVIPSKVDYGFLKKLKKSVAKFSKHRIVIVVGGGKIAREYIEVLKGKNEKVQSLIGIKATKLNAMLVSNFLGCDVVVPDSLNDVKKRLMKKKLVVCGALGYKPHMTSDGTAADVAREINADMLVNMTNVKGLFDKDPRKSKGAKFISQIGFWDFLGRVRKIKYKPGQHFVLDQHAARLITKHKIKTIILKDVANLEGCLLGKNFIGTVIS